MKRIALLCLTALLAAAVWIGLSGSGTVVTTRSLLDYFDHYETGEISREDLLAERFYTMVDEDGREITVTGRKIHVGDEYLTSGNKLYRVYRVQDRIAQARFIRDVGAVFAEEPQGFFVMLRQRLGIGAEPVQADEAQETQGEEEPPEEDEDGQAEEEAEEEEEPAEEENLEPEEQPKRLIGIYHTHNAESYVPTDGTDSINGVGGIHSVGASFTEAFEEKGIRVIHDETLHLPHDRGAYRRSRVTAERLLEQGPDVMFDVHRDAAPMRVYATQIEDEWVTQIQFVVGRQNPTMTVTRQFALDLKNAADEVHPGLVKGIFMARGNYNQDMTPLNLLLEVGAHQNTREAAEDGVALFADVVSFYFYGAVDPDEGELAAPAPAPGQPGRPGAGAQAARGARAATRTILTILAVTAIIVVGFLILNAGSMNDIRFKLMPFMEKARPYTEKSDRFLFGLQEKIYAAGVVVWRTVVAFLESGEQIRRPLQGRIHAAGLRAWEAVRVLLDEGDHRLLPVQEKIRAAALIVKERVEELFGDRRRLR